MNIKKEIKNVNSLIGLGITSLVSFLLFIILYFIWYYLYLIIPINIWDLLQTPNISWESIYLIDDSLFYLWIIFVTTFALTSLIASVMILVTNWETGWLKSKKILWGLLSLFLLSFIGILIFSFTSKKILKIKSYEHQIDEDSNLIEIDEEHKKRIKNKNFKKDKIINNWILSFALISFPFLTAFIVIYITVVPHFWVENHNNIYWELSLAFAIIGGVTSFVGSLMILINKWTLESINKNKIIWGLLSLFLLSFIGLFLFSLISKRNYINKEKNKINNEQTLYSYTKLKNDYKKLILIIIFGIFSFCCLLTFSIYLPLHFKDNNHYASNIYFSLIFSITCAALGGIFNIIASLFILINKWKLRWSKEYKILWGILSLLLLVFIGVFIFTFTALFETKEYLKKTIKEELRDENIYLTSDDINDLKFKDMSNDFWNDENFSEY